MQVILLERVAKLGQMGEVVDVKPGYARNFLLPQKKALTASKANIACLLYTSPSPRDGLLSRMPSSA